VWSSVVRAAAVGQVNMQAEMVQSGKSDILFHGEANLQKVM
jgi:hypothetical protein